MKRHPLYPVFMDLRGRDCIVIGGGKVAERKVRGLVSAGAMVTVVSRDMVSGIERLAKGKRIKLVRRPFRSSDLHGRFMAFCATDNAPVNARVASRAAAEGIIINVADTPSLCDFYLPAVVVRGKLQIALSTGGASPALAARLKKEIAATYGREYGELLRMAGGLRPRLLKSTPAGKRRAVFRALAGPEIVKLLRAGKKTRARDMMREIIRKAAPAGRRG